MDENGAGDRTRTYDPIITNYLAVLVDRLGYGRIKYSHLVQRSDTKGNFLIPTLHGFAHHPPELPLAPLLIPYKIQFALLI